MGLNEPDQSPIPGARTFLAALGAVVLAGLTNGIWQYLLDPALTWSRNAVLTAASLGLTSYQRSLYETISFGLRESASEQTLFLVAAGVVTGIFIYEAHTHQQRQQLHRAADEIDEELRALQQQLKDVDVPVETPNREERIADAHQRLSDLRQRAAKGRQLLRSLRRYTWSGWALEAIVIGILIVTFVQTSYVLSAIAHYDRMRAAAGPSLTPAQEEEIAARFATLRSGEELASLLAELRTAAGPRAAHLPVLEPW